MNTGTIKFFNASKGFGFVAPDGGSADVFLPAAAVTVAGLATIKAGQRITFEQAPDSKGPKVVSLKLIEAAPAKESAPPAEQVTIYCDGGADAIADVVGAVRDLGFALAMQDYIAAPASVDQLRRLSQLLNGSGQSLVHRYHPLFLGLQLDDRFITDQDFWTAIAEHPILIDGPILAISGRARICKTAGEVRAFLRDGEAKSLSKSKTLSPRIAAMLRGEELPAVQLKTPVEPLSAPPAPKRSAEKKGRVAVKPKANSESTAPKRKAAAKSGRTKAPTKKAASKKVAKPAKKAKARAKK